MLNLSFSLPEKARPLAQALAEFSPQADWVSLRWVSENRRTHSFRNGNSDTNEVNHDEGVMIEVLLRGHFAYAATADLSISGLREAFRRAQQLARSGSERKLFNFHSDVRPKSVGTFHSSRQIDLTNALLKDLLETLSLASQKLRVSDAILSTHALARVTETKFHYLTSNGSDIRQEFLLTGSDFSATAQLGTSNQTRSDKGGLARCSQSGLEVFDRQLILERCERIGREASELASAPECPVGSMDLILAPDQMLLQIHESIGHPLEYDRILGDERNYAGWSFIQKNDFGSLQYGSDLMNVVFDPLQVGGFASYAFDECGNPATREYLIKNGKLLRGLGSLESQRRLGIPGVSNFRASSWNRAPIDRMANINLEPGNSSLTDMIKQVERGIYMQSNSSWSIDDYRDKFQFGCEYGQLIENGELKGIVKNPNYRGVTVPFWKSLAAVGSLQELEAYGSPYCGKGEPSQIIRVGHASPPCLFRNVEVFGGGA